MFGIGLPELLIILALALIVVGPEKLPELARSLARGMLELKKTANTLRDSIQKEIEEKVDDGGGFPSGLPGGHQSWNPPEAEMNETALPPETDAAPEELPEKIPAPAMPEEGHPSTPETGESGRQTPP